MNEITIGTSTLVCGDSLVDMSNQKPESFDLVKLDFPFDIPSEKALPWIEQAERIVQPGGNIAIANYPIFMREIFSYTKSLSLTLGDTPITMQGSAHKTKNGLLRRQLAIDVFYKGNIENRTFYPKINGKYGHCLYAPEKEGLLTDLFTYKQHYPCRKGLHGKVLHKGAMAKWLVNNILYCYARKGDSVYDAFGGSGTFPAICRVNNIYCRSVELNDEYYDLMVDETGSNKYKKYDVTKPFISTMENIKNENSSRTTNRLEGSTEGRIGHREETTT